VVADITTPSPLAEGREEGTFACSEGIIIFQANNEVVFLDSG
jgi:hypothetical protein